MKKKEFSCNCFAWVNYQETVIPIIQQSIRRLAILVDRFSFDCT